MLSFAKKLAKLMVVSIVMIVLISSFAGAQNSDKISEYRQFSDWAKYLELKYRLAFYETEYSSHYPSFAKNDPTMNIRKWEVANIIYMANEKEYKKQGYGQLKFKNETFNSPDGPLALTDEQLKRINKLYATKIIDGSKNGTFGMFDEVTYKELTEWIDNAGFSSTQLTEELKVSVLPDDKVTVEQFLAILDILMPNNIEAIQQGFMDTYTRKWPTFRNKCVLHSEEETQILAMGIDTSDAVNRTEYYPFNSWAVEFGKKYDLIFLENNTRECTRSEIASILYHLLDLAETESDDKFYDLDDTDEKTKEKINRLAAINVISGYEDGSFKPNNSVTRAEFVAMLDRTKIISSMKGSTNTNFADVENHWAEESIKNITAIGVLEGKGNNLFCPDDGITPQEILIILDRLVEMKYIAEEELLSSMLNTFKCQKYDDKDRYVIEEIYGKYDEIQNDIEHKWPYNVWNTYYTWEDWNSPVTYNDLLYTLYLASKGNPDITDENISSFENHILNEGINANPQKATSPITNLKGNMEFATWRDALYALSTESLRFFVYLEDFVNDENCTKYFNELLFSNSAQLNDEDKAVLWSVSRERFEIVDNKDMYFNMDGQLTKLMLNYLILQCQVECHIFDYHFEVETDKSKLPNNYEIYPYIVKDIPREVYEIEGIRQTCSGDYQIGDNPKGVTLYRNPLLSYMYFYEQYGDLIRNTEDFYDLILNVDYRTIVPEDFADEVRIYSFTSEELALKYAQYVIDNKIILKGKGRAISGTKSTAGGFGYIRVMIEFEVISADENVDLLYGDFINPNMGYYDRYAPDHIPVVYESNKYFLFFDQEIIGSYLFAGKEFVGLGNYRVVPNAIVRDIYLTDDSIHTLR